MACVRAQERRWESPEALEGSRVLGNMVRCSEGALVAFKATWERHAPPSK